MRIALVLLALASLARADIDLKPLQTWIGRQQGLKTLDTEFVQERKLPALKNPVSTPGRMRMVRPGKLIWELGNPVKTIAVSDGKTMTLLETDKKRGKRIDTDSTQARQFTLLSDQAFHDLEGFQQTFELVESRVTNGIYQLTVRPKDRTLRNQVPWMFLDIDLKSYELRALDIELEDKSRIRTIFTNPKINGKIDDAVFTPDLTGYRIL